MTAREHAELAARFADDSVEVAKLENWAHLARLDSGAQTHALTAIALALTNHPGLAEEEA